MQRKRSQAYKLGKSGEEIALKYLKQKKYKLIANRFRMFRGEIDIIAYEQETLVFIEVKTRRSADFGLPEEFVNPSKQRQIKKIAQGFLSKNNLHEIACRFDVLSLLYDDKNGYSIHHIKNAF